MPSLWSILSRWTTRQSPPNSDLRFLQDPLDGAIDELRRDQFRVSSNVTKESRWRGPTTHRGNLAFSHYLNKWEEALSFAKTVRDKTCDKSSVGPRVQQFRWELSQEEKNVADRGGAESDLTDGMTEKLEKYCSLLLSSVCRLPKNATVDDQDAKEFVRLANRTDLRGELTDDEWVREAVIMSKAREPYQRSVYHTDSAAQTRYRNVTEED